MHQNKKIKDLALVGSLWSWKVLINVPLNVLFSQSEQDENMIQMAGDDVDVPEELLKMVDEDATEEEEKDSIFGQIQNLQNMDMDQIKEKAQATLTEMKTKAEEKCSVMWQDRTAPASLQVQGHPGSRAIWSKCDSIFFQAGTSK